MYKLFSTILLPLMFCISTLHTGASLIGVYGRISPVYLWNVEKQDISMKNLGGNANFGWQLNRTEEVDFDFLWGAQQMGLSGGYPVLSMSHKHLMSLSHNVKMYTALGCSIRMREFKFSERVIMPLVTVGFVYYHTPKLSVELFGKRHFVFNDFRLNRSPIISRKDPSLLGRVSGDIPVLGMRVGYYLF